MTKPSPAHRRRLRFFTTIALLPFVLLALNGTVALYSPTLILSMARPRDLSKICCGPGCRLPVTGKVDQVTTHYDNNYFQWQTQLGREKASSKDWNKFLDVKPTDTVADLGAGGGHILASLNVSRRIAVEINPIARGSIHKNYPGKVETFSYPEDVPDNSVDFLFSTSAIEHFECPLTELREMARKVRKGGRVMIGVKNEGVQYAGSVNKDDTNQHLYTWNRQLLFNLIRSAGFQVSSIDPHISKVFEKGKTWTHPDDFTTHATFIYHWAVGTKVE
eukprot:gb/GEZJ01000589.1/.p1 GENE.gb/GEZJ01000589.1/~~gb/GEZJ01000589.1/.p1  ORF type:complete len:276 (-),score=25.15 gb/GEZJ01000589.1/:419-1246(-)